MSIVHPSQAIIKKVNAICRSFIWHADANNKALGNVNWKDVCKPKKLGGLGIRNIEYWNKAIVGKLAWHVSDLSESLWARNIHGVYTKGANLMIFNPPITASWFLKKICGVKDKLSTWVMKEKYRISKIYLSYFEGHPKLGAYVHLFSLFC